MAHTMIPLDDGPWRVATDPENVGRGEQWWREPVREARKTRVPGMIQETWPGYHGVAWYWRTFDAPDTDAPGRWLLRFWAVDYLAEAWVNDVAIGGHAGGETPFELDVTDALRPGTNRLAVRVLNPTDDPIDGCTLRETPHRNKTHTVKAGSMYNAGGISDSVALLRVPMVRIAGVFARPDWQSGEVRVTATVIDAADEPIDSRLSFRVTPACRGESVAEAQVEATCAPGETRIETTIRVPHHRLWDLEDPYLYQLTTRLAGDGETDSYETRFGFRDFRVVDGYFRLNGRRIFLKSSHTGNHCPVGYVFPPDQAPDLLRRDLVYAKASGFNMVRFIAGMAHPRQLDLCDELGLMVYEENLAAWNLEDSPKMAERFDRSLREMILRDRNHACLTIWGLMNETKRGPVFDHAVESLSLLRELDDSRLVLLGSGRWDGRFDIGSVSNPGSTGWEHQWGVEAPDHPGEEGPIWEPVGGYTPKAGDAHVYPGVPHTPEVEHMLRTLGHDTKPVFLSEYGTGSLCNAIREWRHYEQAGLPATLDDATYYRNQAEQLKADLRRLGMNAVFPFAEDLLVESQRLHNRQRTLGFDLIRSNPNLCGFNLTGLLDHGFSGEGLWSLWREWKPGIVDALQDGWAPLRWCLFASPMHGFRDEPVRLEVVLANEDVLAPGTYPVTLCVFGPEGLVWEHRTEVRVPEPTAGKDGPLALPVFAEEITPAGPPGRYTFAVSMDAGGAPAGGRLAFYRSDRALPESGIGPVAAWGLDPATEQWLSAHGITCREVNDAPTNARGVVLVGDVSDRPDAEWIAVLRRVAQGDVAVFLLPGAFQRGEDAVARLPLANKGKGYAFPDWLYHKECVAKRHPVFAGVQAGGIMDWDYYGPVIPRFIFESQDTPDEVMAAAFALCHGGAEGDYAAGTLVGRYAFGAGSIILNSLHLVENLATHPAAGRILCNLVAYAAQMAEEPCEPLPDSFDRDMIALGYAATSEDQHP